MMTNMFSTFDPATSMNMSLNWSMAFIGLMIIPMSFWILPNRLSMMMMQLNKTLHNEFKTLVGPSALTLMFIAMFSFIFFNNIMGLIPYIFTSSSHMTFTLALALPMWLSIILFGWINKTSMMLAHTIPDGTPPILMPFMVMIETISNLIRPGALAVRLMANMTAGHILMALLGEKINSTISIIPIIIILQMGIMMFEAAVAIIQAYVFSILSTLYTGEVIYE
uniref:ATP synthase subunit a n=1 Tax=Micronecta sahlbergii TaxID=2304347 RepID=A0A346LZK2_9HEMI|nr:ATP synthase F0 subunit 6 [Micronecta sahlbergii]AXQ02197.1 ATP synthase F0 subunit 6 [Micronecta sahlbergii]